MEVLSGGVGVAAGLPHKPDLLRLAKVNARTESPLSLFSCISVPRVYSVIIFLFAGRWVNALVPFGTLPPLKLGHLFAIS